MKHDLSASLFVPPDQKPAGKPLEQPFQRSFRSLLPTLCIAAPIIALAMYLYEAVSLLLFLVAALWPSLIQLLLLHGTRHVDKNPSLLAACVLFTGIGGMAVDGTGHSDASLVILATVMAGGTFLRRKANTICADTAVSALAILKLAEDTGIGLATVRRIVERHAGQIHGDARPRERATLRFAFEAVPKTMVSTQPAGTSC